jgi:hypothetical protein
LWLEAWNGFGLLDLLTAVTLAMLSVPNTPFRSFSEGPGTLVMGTLPWMLAPAMLVAVDFLVHVVIMAKLNSLSSGRGDGGSRLRFTKEISVTEPGEAPEAIGTILYGPSSDGHHSGGLGISPSIAAGRVAI